jgi:hypothetical protein
MWIRCIWLSSEQWWALVNTVIKLWNLQGREYLDKLEKYWLLKKGFAACS